MVGAEDQQRGRATVWGGVGKVLVVYWEDGHAVICFWRTNSRRKRTGMIQGEGGNIQRVESETDRRWRGGRRGGSGRRVD